MHTGDLAWVRLTQGSHLTAADLAEARRTRIARYKIPRYWKIVEEFPRTITGKTQKYRMREIAIAELGLRTARAAAA